jgi:hypothetical protein
MGTKSYDSADKANHIEPSLVIWTLAPELRVHSNGKLRAIGGLALGLEGEYVSAKVTSTSPLSTAGGSAPLTGSGVSGMGMLEGGAQLEAGRLLFEATLFVNLHGVGAAQSNELLSGSDGRFFGDSPAVRGGLRALIGYTF